MRIVDFIKGLLIAISFVSFLILFHISAFAETDTIEGNVVCVQNDSLGKVTSVYKYSSCEGALIVVSNDDKIYSLNGSEEQIKNIEQSPEKIKRLKGYISGNERAWLFNISTLKPLNELSSENREIKGDLYCLVPDPETKNVKTVISDKPCSSESPHAHVLSTNEGRIYTVVGDESSMLKLEKSKSRLGMIVNGGVVKDSAELVVN